MAEITLSSAEIKLVAAVFSQMKELPAVSLFLSNRSPRVQNHTARLPLLHCLGAPHRSRSVITSLLLHVG
jgi:hypothetical protein